MRKLLFVALIASCPYRAFLQSSALADNIPVTNRSEPGTPLLARGSARISSKTTGNTIEYAVELSADLENVSSKPVMAFEAIVDLSPSFGGGDHVVSRIDYFFSDQRLMPHNAYRLTVPYHKGLVSRTRDEKRSTRDDTAPGEAVAEVRVTFVQFIDGTVFGASDWATNLTTQREKLSAMVRGFVRAFDRDKDKGLREAIDRAQADPQLSDEIRSALMDIHRRFERAGAPETIRYLNQYLMNGRRNARLASGTRQSSWP